MGSMVALELERLDEMRAAFAHDPRRTVGLSVVIGQGRRVYAQLQAYVHHEPADPRFARREAARWLDALGHLGAGFEEKGVHQRAAQRSRED
jgi:hypothetical protein